MKKKNIAISFLLLLVAAGIWYYVSLPAFNIHSSGVWYFVLVLVLAVGLVFAGKKGLRYGAIDLKEMKDTVKLDLSGYVPPITKHVTSDFGFRRWRFHYGIDLKVEKGDSVLCAFDGTVRLTRRDRRGYGYFVLVRHFNGLETLYGHLARITVNPGDTIKAGVPVGLGGNTGRSTGYHLHFELRYLGNPLNPNDLIDFQSCCTKNNILQLNASHFSYKKEIDKIRFWKVRRGDTLGRIAMRTGVSISKLCKLNGIKRSTKLRIGRNLRYT